MRIYGVPGGYGRRRGWQGRFKPHHIEAQICLAVFEQRNSTIRIMLQNVYLEIFGPLYIPSPLLISQGNFNI